MNLFEHKLYSSAKTIANLRAEVASERSLRMLAEDKLPNHLNTHTCISDKRMAEYAKDGDMLHIPIIKPYVIPMDASDDVPYGDPDK